MSNKDCQNVVQHQRTARHRSSPVFSRWMKKSPSIYCLWEPVLKKEIQFKEVIVQTATTLLELKTQVPQVCFICCFISITRGFDELSLGWDELSQQKVGIWSKTATAQGQSRLLSRRDLNPLAWIIAKAGDLTCYSGWSGCLNILCLCCFTVTAGPAFLTAGPLISLHSICQGQTSHPGIDDSPTSQMVEDLSATSPDLVWMPGGFSKVWSLHVA